MCVISTPNDTKSLANAILVNVIIAKITIFAEKKMQISPKNAANEWKILQATQRKKGAQIRLF